MRASDSPFPCDWWGHSFEDVGLADIRPSKRGTYGRYDYRSMPRVPLELNGELDWLASAPTQEHHIGEWMEEKIPGKNSKAIIALKRATTKLRLPLPTVFVKFMETPALHQKIRSSTDCFLDLGRFPVPSPKGGGYLIRFLCDSQGCIFWYLFLTADGSDHAVVASLDFYGTKAERRAAANWVSEEPNPEEIVFCGESFEEFLCRLWLENEIWFAAWQKTPLPPGGATYIQRYQERQKELVALRPDVSRWETPTGFFPWPHVQRWINRLPHERFEAFQKELREERGGTANSCPGCGRRPADLLFFLVLSPEESWEAGQGQLGYLTLCERCRLQVGFLVDQRATEAQTERWREERRLI